MSGFGKMVADSKTNEGGVYWMEGKYLVQVNALKVIQGRKGGEYFILEGDTLTSNNAQRSPGTSCSWVVNMSQDATPGNIKGCIASIMGLASPDEVSADVADAAVASDNPLHGRLVNLQVTTIQTRAGSDFSLHRWSGVPESFQASAAALREEAGLTPLA